MAVELTVEWKVWLFLEERSEKGEPPPSYCEIGRRFGFKSAKAAFDHVVALEKKGYVIRQKGAAHGLHLVRRSIGIPVLGRIVAGLPAGTSHAKFFTK